MEAHEDVQTICLGFSTLNAAYGEIMNSLVNTAQDHINVADNLTTQVVDVLKLVEKKNEELKKKEIQFYQKLVSDRDRVYAERVKTKQKYDEECADVESHRLKQTRAQDDRHAERAAKQAEQQKNDMLNSKNVYIIATTLANRAKAKFFDEDLPGLEDQLQELQTRLVDRFVKILLHSQALQQSHLDAVKSRLAVVEGALGGVNPTKDEGLFIEYNVRTFNVPGDWAFEPCTIHYDTAEMSVEPGPKVFLQNKLAKCRTKLQELDPLVDSKQKDFNQLTKIVESQNVEHSSDVIDVGRNLLRFKEETKNPLQNYIDARQQLTFFSASQCILRAEADVIVDALGAQSPITPSASSFVRDARDESSDEAYPLARVLFDFTPTSEFELRVSEGMSVRVLEADDGSGWVKVSISGSNSGLVPASYIEVVEEEDTPSSSSGHSIRSSGSQGSGKYVRAIYAYESQGPDEISLKEGETVELSGGPRGGQFYGDGWWEGLDSRGRKGIFPSNYVCATDLIL
ncbi:hypothetical protein ONZ45_g333 [Pleurotus djamor]|nr:hypothetical protein ONZ45_g333 [Pleurotus djamor]